MTNTVSESTPVAADERHAAYVSGLRKLADFMEQHPEFGLPYHGADEHATIRWIKTWESDQRGLAAAWHRATPGRTQKAATDSYMSLVATFDGVHAELMVRRDEVCERVVIGTEEVEITEPDPEAVKALPQVTRTEKREIVEWQCGSILAGADDASA